VKRPLDLAAIVLSALLLLALAVLSIRGMTAPELASARFGAPVTDPPARCSIGSICPAISLLPSPARFSWFRGNGRRWPFS